MSDKDDKRLQLYLEDSRDQLDGIENDILLLEQSVDGLDEELINRLFRRIHSVKGGAAFLGLKKIKELSHVTEDVLNEIRNKTFVPSHEDINILLSSSDHLKTMINDPSESPNIDIEQVLGQLHQVLENSSNEKDDSSIDTDTKEVSGDTENEEGSTSDQTEDRNTEGSLGIPSDTEPRPSEDPTSLQLSNPQQTGEGNPAVFSLKLNEIETYIKQGFNIYLLCFQSSYFSLNGFTQGEVKTKLDEIGYLLDSSIDSSDQQDSSSELEQPFTALITTVLTADLTVNFLEIPDFCLSYLEIDPNEISHSKLVPYAAPPQTLEEDSTVEQKTEDRTHEPHIFPENPNNIKRKVEDQGLKEEQITQAEPEPVASQWVEPESITPEPAEPVMQQTPNPQPTQKKEEIKVDTVIETQGGDLQDAGPPPPHNRRASDTPGTGDKPETTSASTIRVNVNILDTLMNLAGELVLTRNQLNQTVSIWDKYSIEIAAQRLDGVTSELQETIMSTRMQPIGIVFNKFQRVVRDMSKKLDKSVTLNIKGEDVELDKTIIENISDPLTHLVRNAIDHGIETPTKRKMTGKPEEGILQLIAKHEAGHVIIEIIDDGAGIDANVIKDKALEKGIIDKAQLDEMSDNDIYKLVFTPGFSTAKEVTDVSGRGVGMDVVLTNITQLGGTIDINTLLGKGTTFRIKLPLTLAIIPSLLIQVNNENFAIPQVNLVELVRIPPAQVKKRLEKVGDAIVTRLRGKLLPVIRLSDFLGIDDPLISHPDTQEALVNQREMTDRREDQEDSESDAIRSGEERRIRAASSVNIVVVSAGEFLYGIIVDNLMDSEEIVVKPLGYHLRDCVGYAGATILGDGSAALIIDVMGVASFMKLSEQDHLDDEQEEKFQQAQKLAGDIQSLLIIENGKNEQFGVQLAFIHRIERIKPDQIQKVGNKTVTQYRGGALMLFSIEEAINVGDRAESNDVFLILFTTQGKEVAIMASSIVDIVDINTEVDHTTFKQPGVVGSAIILDRITLLLDLFGLVKKLMPEWEDDSSHNTEESIMEASQKTVLVVEDTPFFREHIKGILQESGLKVITANDGKEGLDRLYKEGDTIDLILSDIEMPVMDGFELVAKIRAGQQFNQIKIVMLSSLSSDEDIKRAKDAGANEYLVKIDQELLIRTTKEMLGLL